MSKIKRGQNVISPIYSGYRRHRRNPEQILIREEKYKERNKMNYERQIESDFLFEERMKNE